jgi:hypothetical protein
VADPTAHLPGMFEDAKAYCVARYRYDADIYVSAEAREEHIERDARSTATDRDFAMPWNAGYARGVSEGRRQALTELIDWLRPMEAAARYRAANYETDETDMIEANKHYADGVYLAILRAEERLTACHKEASSG